MYLQTFFNDEPFDAESANDPSQATAKEAVDNLKAKLEPYKDEIIRAGCTVKMHIVGGSSLVRSKIDWESFPPELAGRIESALS